jgi:hypothetical protein
MEFETEERHQDGSSELSGTKNMSRPSSANVVNRAPGLVSSGQEINWEEYIGLSSTQTFEYDNGSDARTEPFTLSETEQIYRRHFPDLVVGNVENAVGEAQVRDMNVVA